MITVKMPVDFEFHVRELPNDLRAQFKSKIAMTGLYVNIPPGSSATIQGFGMPFSGANATLGDWVNKDGIMVDGMTLRQFLCQKSFRLVVGKTHTDWMTDFMPRCLVSTYAFPYGTAHYYDMERYLEMRDVMKGARMEPCATFDNDNDHVAVITQSVIQDIFWLALEAAEIFTIKMSGKLLSFPRAVFQG